MADTSQGPGWWIASDGKWYSPEQAPGTPAYQSAGAASADDPVEVRLIANAPIANWRALVHLVMAIPHFVVNYVLGFLRNVLWVLSFFSVLFVARVPAGIRETQMMTLRYNNRLMSFVLLLNETYPPFEFSTNPTDPGGYPLVTSFKSTDHMARWRCLQPYLLIPHLVVLLVVYIAAAAAYVVGWFRVLFTGRQSDDISKFLVGAGRWTTRVYAYGTYLTDRYPPFSLD